MGQEEAEAGEGQVEGVRRPAQVPLVRLPDGVVLVPGIPSDDVPGLTLIWTNQ